MNWSVVPFAIEVLAAVMLIDCSVAAVTVSANVLEVMPLCVAVTLLDPIATPVANPLVVIVAAAVLEEIQVAELVKS